MLPAEKENPLGTKPLGKLLFSLAVPAVIANVVNALYNIVDQIFIGNGIGYLGNAATSVSFPLTTICMAIGLMTGLGSAAGFNLELGRKNEELAKKYAGNAASILIISGVVICIIVRIFLKKTTRSFRCERTDTSLCSDLCGNHFSWHSFPAFFNRHKSSCKSGQKSEIFYGGYCFRCSSKYDS